MHTSNYLQMLIVCVISGALRKASFESHVCQLALFFSDLMKVWKNTVQS